MTMGLLADFVGLTTACVNENKASRDPLTGKTWVAGLISML